MTSDLILVAVSLFAWGVGEGLFVYFQPLYLQQFGATPIQIGAILGGMGIAMALMQIPAGYLGDRLGRRPFMWASWIVGTLSAWVMAMALSLPVFVVGLLLYGLTSFVMAPMNSYITHARGKLSVARALTFSSAAYNLGAVAGPVIGGNLADRYGLRFLYMIAASIFIISTLIVLFIKKQPVEHRSESLQQSSLRTNTRFITLMIILFFTMFSMYLPQPLASNFLQNQRGLTFGSIGILGSIGSLGNAVLALVLGAINAKAGFMLGQVAVIAFSLCLWRGHDMPWYMAGYFLLGGYRVSKSLSMALTRPLIHAAQMGVAYGIIETMASSAIILSPIVSGFIYASGPEKVFPISAVLIAIAFLVAAKWIPQASAKHTEILITPERGLD